MFIRYDRSPTTLPTVVSVDYPRSLTTFSTILISERDRKSVV